MSTAKGWASPLASATGRQLPATQAPPRQLWQGAPQFSGSSLAPCETGQPAAPALPLLAVTVPLPLLGPPALPAVLALESVTRCASSKCAPRIGSHAHGISIAAARAMACAARAIRTSRPARARAAL